jgi:hypothetical protein
MKHLDDSTYSLHWRIRLPLCSCLRSDDPMTHQFSLGGTVDLMQGCFSLLLDSPKA